MLAICHNPLSWMCRLPVPASRSMPKATQVLGFQFDIAPGQTPQNVADQLLNEIQNRLGGAAQETVDVRIETGEGGELSLVLQSSAGPITAGINFESSIQGQSGTQQINTVELPDQLDPGETLELTLTGLPGAGEVNLSQTLDAGETLLDAAQSLVADIATLTGAEGEPLGLSAEVVTHQPPIQVVAPEDTVVIPSDIGDLSQSVQLEFTLENADGGSFDFALTINPGQSPQGVAEQMSQQIRLGHPFLTASVQTEVRLDPETGDVSLVLQPLGVSPFTVDVINVPQTTIQIVAPSG